MQCGRDGKAACGNTQLCTGLEAGIEGAIHASIRRANGVNTLQFPAEDPPQDTPTNDPPNENTPEPTQANNDTLVDPEVHFLTDARNGFGKLSGMAILWEVRHR